MNPSPRLDLESIQAVENILLRQNTNHHHDNNNHHNANNQKRSNPPTTTTTATACLYLYTSCGRFSRPFSSIPFDYYNMPQDPTLVITAATLDFLPWAFVCFARELRVGGTGVLGILFVL